MLSFSNEKLMEMVDNAKTRKVDYYGASLIGDLASQFLSERKERENNPGVWDGAPGWAITAGVQWGDGKGHGKWREESYRRTLPKTKAREIAERFAAGVMDGDRCVTLDMEGLPNLIESAIIEAQKDGAS